MDEKSPPIEEQNYLYGVNVVDIGDFRIARGLSKRPFTTCKHSRLTYDQNERRIWCNDCETDINHFDAFKSIAENVHGAYAEINRKNEELTEALKHNIRLIAVKKLDKIWQGKNVPCCKNCGHGIHPEDVSRMGVMGKNFSNKLRESRCKK